MALRKYSSVHCNFLERTLINIASRKIWLSCFQRKNYNQYLVSSSLCCCFRCQSVVHCSIQGNFHLVIKAVFLFFFFFFACLLSSLSFYLPFIHLIPLKHHWHTYHTPVIPIHLHDMPIAQMLMMHYTSSTFCRSDIPQQSIA